MYPWLPLTDREVPPNEELPDRANDGLLEPDRDPLIELLLDALDPKCEPEVEELPKCEPSMFDTPRFGEIELRDDPSILLRPEVADPLLKFPAREFDATDGEFDPRDAPAAEELPANERPVDPPAAEFPPARVPAVFPVLGPRALPVLPANECQLPSAFARVAPRPAGQPDERAFNEFERPAFEPAPLRAFIDELPPARPPFIPFERAPPYVPLEREPPYMLPPPRP